MAVDIPGMPALMRFARLRDAAFVHNKEEFGGANAVALMNGKRQDTDTLVASLHLNLLMYEFPGILIVIFEDKVVFLGSAKKLAHLDGMKQAAVDVAAGKIPSAHGGDPHGFAAIQRAPLAVEFLTRPKSGDDKASFESLLADVTSRSSGSTAKLGIVLKEPGVGDFATSWQAAVIGAGVATVDASAGLVRCMTIKDRVAAEELQHAAQLTVAIARKRFLGPFMTAVEDNKLPTHAALSDQANAAAEEGPTAISSTLSKLSADYCDVGIGACVQSGGNYVVDVRNARPDSKKLSPDTVLFSFGARYRSSNALVARTYLINPTKAQTEVYKALLEAHGTMIEGLREGAVVGEVVKEARAILKKAAPGATIPASLGSGIGVLLDETPLGLTEDSELVVAAGMCFAVITALQDAGNSEAEVGARGNKGMAKFSQVLGDTVFVLPEGSPSPNEVLTKKSKRELNDIRFTLDDEDDGDEDDDGDDDGDDEDDEEGRSARAGGVRRSTRIQAVQGDTEAIAEARAQRDKQLRKIFMLQTAEARAQLERSSGGASKETAIETAVRQAKPIQAYSSPTEFPPAAPPNRMFVDRDRQSVLLPIYGQLVPFDIATIRSVVKTDEAGRTFLRINFYAPGGSAGKDCPPAMLAAMEKHPHLAYIKTLNFQAKDGRNIAHVTRLIKEIQKRLKAELAHKHERSNLVKQPKLMLNRTGKVPRLQRLNMYPRLSGKKSVGSLEAHHNGLRFRSERGEIVDMIYDNIRHAIFQPCIKDLHVIMHFHLRNPIMVGKKKHRDIKFFADVVDATQSLEGVRRSMYDPDELVEEQRERQLRKQLNNAFKVFVQKVEAMAQSEPAATSLEFDVPSRDLSFMGKAQKEMVEISPCRDCLVALADNPPYVLTLDDIEHVHFERVIYGSKNFDVSFVLKPDVVEAGGDEVKQITMIPTTNLETIQNWLVDVVERPYTQGVRSMAWKSFLAGFVRQPSFYASHDEDGEAKPVGWLILADDSGSEDEGGGGDGDDDFEDEEDDEEEEDDDAEFEEAVDDDDEEDDEEDDDEFEEADDEEEPADWDKLERDAAEEDRRAEAADRERAKRDAEDDTHGGKRSRGSDERSGKKVKRV